MIPRVLLALDQPSLQQELHQVLVGLETIERRAGSSQELVTLLEKENHDLILVSTKFISKRVRQALEDVAEQESPPDLVLLQDEQARPSGRPPFPFKIQAHLSPQTSSASYRKILTGLLARRRRLRKMPLDLGRRFARPRLSDFASRCEDMQLFLQRVRQLVKSEASILIQGETGVGKERLARAIHNESARAKGPFVAVNCGALPESLMESELFGHEKGSFTGATRKHRGFFEMANRGTVFLDEIGDLPYHSQVKLLRVLQEREVQRVGGERTLKFDVRVIVDTNRELKEEVRAGRFRMDLFYRLNVVSLTIPPLRERKEDIPDLAYSYLQYYRSHGKNVATISERALDALTKYSWPGNVRELVNIIERAILFCPGREIKLSDLPEDIFQPPAAAMWEGAKTAGETSPTLSAALLNMPIRRARKQVVETFERAYLSELLRATQGRIGETARRAGIQPRALFEKMRQYGLQKETFKEQNGEAKKGTPLQPQV